MSRLDEIKARHQLRCHESGCECLDALAAEVARLTAERDALAAQVARVEAVCRRFENWPSSPSLSVAARYVRAALAGSTGQEAAPDAGHKCEPCYSRAECGQCGWQEQWCVTCQRQMCGCATESTGQECVKVWPDPGHEDEGYSCVTHNCAWDECPTNQEGTR